MIEGLTLPKNFLTGWFLNFSPVSFVDSSVHVVQSALLLLENLKRSKVKPIRRGFQKKKQRKKKNQKEWGGRGGGETVASLLTSLLVQLTSDKV